MLPAHPHAHPPATFLHRDPFTLLLCPEFPPPRFPQPKQAAVFEPSTADELAAFTRRYCELSLRVRDMERAAAVRVETLEAALREKEQQV